MYSNKSRPPSPPVPSTGCACSRSRITSKVTKDSDSRAFSASLSHGTLTTGPPYEPPLTPHPAQRVELTIQTPLLAKGATASAAAGRLSTGTSKERPHLSPPTGTGPPEDKAGRGPPRPGDGVRRGTRVRRRR
nr:hypothetical protein StreXyl84_77520 [Streptomyces sp. Xyl84]